MAIATDPAPAAIDLRWELANYGRPTRYTNSEEIFLTFTKRHERVDAALEEIAAMLVQDGVLPEERQEDADSLEDLTGNAWAAIEKLFKEWAGRAPERRARIHAKRQADTLKKALAPIASEVIAEHFGEIAAAREKAGTAA